MALCSMVVDFNSYFASVEQQLQPKLRGLPVAVVPVMAESTCCIAASYEAKKFGVRTGTRVSDARHMCPGLKVVEARPSLYVECHHDLIKAVDSCVHVEEIWSIDEMACELTGKWQQREKACELALKIKKKIATTVGEELRCSIGIAPNPFLAKTASDMQKPDGLVVIEQQDLPQCLYHLELRDFGGIGRNMEKRLHQHGIRTVEAFCAASKDDLRRVWGGVGGERMYQALRGEFVYRAPTNKSSVGHSHVMPPEERNEASAFSVLSRLLQKAAMRLRKMRYCAGGMQLFVKHTRDSQWNEECTFLETQDTIELLRVLRMLWKRRSPGSPPPLAVGVTLCRLVEEENLTASLFEKDSSRRDLNARIDKINNSFGKNTIYFAGAHDARESAPMRIAFNYVPDVETDGD